MSKICTSAVWRKAQAAAGSFAKKRSQWLLEPLLRVALCMALSHAPSRREQFVEARAWLGRRRGGGRTFEGFRTALGKLPPAVPSALREGLQEEALRLGLRPARVGRWEAYGFDGTIVDLPLTDALLRHFGAVTKEPGRPQMLLVAAVALQLRLLWDWEMGCVRDGERALARRIMGRLPVGALGVMDAGFVGYEFLRETLAQGRHVLLRAGANFRFWAEQKVAVERHGGEVWLWPNAARRADAPLKLRLIPVRRKVRKWQKYKRRRQGRRGRVVVKVEVLWLLTDVLAEGELSAAEAQELYARRWPANEIGFRNWKHTLQGEKMRSRTPRQVRREAEFLLLAMQGLQVLGLRAQAQRGGVSKVRAVSISLALQAWRKAAWEIVAGRRPRWLRRRLSEAVHDSYRRRRPKSKRRWAQRKAYCPTGRPKISQLTPQLKLKGERRLEAAGG